MRRAENYGDLRALQLVPCGTVSDLLYASYRLLRPVQYIAALGDPGARSGSNADAWGLWAVDPGPRGLRLEAYRRGLEAAPAGWRLDAQDWWLEEHGLVMEPPSTPLAPGKYTVTGDREVTTTLTVRPPDGAGAQQWELADGASLLDVTHLPCRSARYVRDEGGGPCSPAEADRAAFPVRPGAVMPEVGACRKQDYAVLFVLGYEPP